jgi:hypothetical protein
LPHGQFSLHTTTVHRRFTAAKLGNWMFSKRVSNRVEGCFHGGGLLADSCHAENDHLPMISGAYFRDCYIEGVLEPVNDAFHHLPFVLQTAGLANVQARHQSSNMHRLGHW